MSQVASQLAVLGWDPYFDQKFKAKSPRHGVPARVVADYGSEYAIHDGSEIRRASARRADPAVGDWVVLADGYIVDVLDRRTVLSRRSAGQETTEQVLASNIDTAFVVAAATDVNVRRIERYLTIAWQSGAVPLVVITKADITDPIDMALPGVEIAVTSCVTGQGIDEVARTLQPSKTGVLLGPSGVGKSSLINRLVGDEMMRTHVVHRSGEGRHVTSHRQLIQLPRGGMIIDGPGLREAQLWEGEGALGNIFEDVEELALGCRFSDCAHDSEPGCAIKRALADGNLDAARLESYRKLKRELRAVAAKSDARIRAEDRRRWKQITIAARQRTRP
ncbi:MAG TPA: ribosome small subunit-dependent GTPase A [Candidatus Udaeobacter sp.]|nr:ribosome small subunit-dependent GTPase A [Candidatus Udaeobacter sp.]